MTASAFFLFALVSATPVDVPSAIYTFGEREVFVHAFTIEKTQVTLSDVARENQSWRLQPSTNGKRPLNRKTLFQAKLLKRLVGRRHRAMTSSWPL
ncbi:MAG: hypothetical protein GY822_29250 [Deltaproteobacteria bacterium]|nr:hypothetical protein [Deltaproteobacteria bacterium]